MLRFAAIISMQTARTASAEAHRYARRVRSRCFTALHVHESSVMTSPKKPAPHPPQRGIKAPNILDPDPKAHPMHRDVPTQPIHEGTDPKQPVRRGNDHPSR
jgi:hypothetical protein